MERCGFFDAYLTGEVYDRVYLAAQFAAYFASFIGNGVYARHGNQLQVMAQSNPSMSIQVLSGQGWINGYWYENTDSMNLSVEVADGVLNRIDSIVLQLGFSERDIKLKIKKGMPATNPVAPALVRNSDYYELQLATVSIPASSIRITQAQITDTRMNASVCGWVTGVIDQIDTTTLFNQFETYFNEFKENNQADYESWTDEQKQAWLSWVSGQETDFTDWTEAQKQAWLSWVSGQEADYESWTEAQKQAWLSWVSGQETDFTDWTDEQKAEYDEWFQNIKDQLGEDMAGNLQNQIDEHEARLNNLEMMLLATGMLFAANEISTGECLTTNDDYVLLFEWPICQC